MKTLFKLVGALVIVLIIAVVAGILYLDRGIKAAVETLGPRFTKTTVSLDRATLSLRSGEGSLKGLTVANPPGYRAPDAFSLGEIAIAVDTGSIKSGPIVLNSIRIIAPEITYEGSGSNNNLKQLQNNVSQAAGSTRSTATESDAGEGRKLIIRDLLITGGQVHYRTPLLGDKTVDLDLPEIRLTGIGEKSNGATAAEATSQIMAAINRQVAKAAANSTALKDMEGQLKGRLDERKGELEGKLEGLKGLFDK